MIPVPVCCECWTFVRPRSCSSPLSPQARFVPVSGQQGENIKTPSKEHMPWYTGSTLLEALAAITPPDRGKEEAKPLRMPVQVCSQI